MILKYSCIRSSVAVVSTVCVCNNIQNKVATVIPEWENDKSDPCCEVWSISGWKWWQIQITNLGLSWKEKKRNSRNTCGAWLPPGEMSCIIKCMFVWHTSHCYQPRTALHKSFLMLISSYTLHTRLRTPPVLIFHTFTSRTSTTTPVLHLSLLSLSLLKSFLIFPPCTFIHLGSLHAAAPTPASLHLSSLHTQGQRFSIIYHISISVRYSRWPREACSHSCCFWLASHFTQPTFKKKKNHPFPSPCPCPGCCGPAEFITSTVWRGVIMFLHFLTVHYFNN